MGPSNRIVALQIWPFSTSMIMGERVTTAAVVDGVCLSASVPRPVCVTSIRMQSVRDLKSLTMSC